MAMEVRYVGTRSRQQWTNYNFNEFNVIENGFLNEFRVAQANLQANIAAGRGNTFAFTGAPGHGTPADLPGVLQRLERDRQHRPTPGPTGRMGPGSATSRR
jgi:hypothetical protein